VLSQTLKFSFYICAVLALLGIPLSLLIPVFYGAAYAQAAPATMILLGGMVFASLASISPQHFFSLGKPRIHLLLSGLTLLLNTLLNLLWIPLWGISGAALASSISYLAFGLGYLAVFILREGFTLSELLALNRQDLKEIWNRKTN
jgi:O-antigen/teichoic acid export membrane protein